MTTRKPASSATRRSTRARTGARRTTTRAGGGTRRTTRRSTPKVATTVGSAIGLLIVTALTNMSWGQRIALAGVVIVLGLGYLLWSNRREIAAAETPSAPTDSPSPQDSTPLDSASPQDPKTPQKEP